MKYIVANLKAHQNLGEAVNWINKFVNTVRSDAVIRELLSSGRVTVILAPSAPYLITFKSAIHEFQNIAIAAQDISQFIQGSYTGETGSHALEGIVSYAIIGHSERRKYSNETNESVRLKVENAARAGITPIVCYRTLEDVTALDQGIVAYEPADAIGGGKNYPVETVVDFKNKLQLMPSIPFLYGGSVDEQNERLYLKTAGIDGLLVGTAALDASRFCEMLRQI